MKICQKTHNSMCPQNSAIFVLQKRWGGSGERLFETFPKIHPFWRRRLSLMYTIKYSMVIWAGWVVRTAVKPDAAGR